MPIRRGGAAGPECWYMGVIGADLWRRSDLPAYGSALMQMHQLGGLAARDPANSGRL